MIFDTLNNRQRYYDLGDRIQKALNYLANTDFQKCKNGIYELEGKDVFAIVSQYETRKEADSFWEAHKKYIDIQYLISGKEKIGYAPISNMESLGNYNHENDFEEYVGKGTFIPFFDMSFFILFPEDTHLPGIVHEEASKVRKVVVKVRI
ncbi:MAG: YhcH/YjgK/YiaL family protein [Saprospiraceae bacterium]|jgi:YhcH/YjgK/YiaL family protein|nr:YhcH/YjgK/YiaL family protein [Saprospiraceae bacterium]